MIMSGKEQRPCESSESRKELKASARSLMKAGAQEGSVLWREGVQVVLLRAIIRGGQLIPLFAVQTTPWESGTRMTY